MLDFTDLIGKKNKLRGRGPDEYDCYGLCLEIYKRLGKSLPEQPEFTTVQECANQIQDAKETGSFIRLEKPEPYCLVTFMIHPPLVTHVGVVLDNCFQFIHTMKNRAVCIERLEGLLWSKRIDGFYQFTNSQNQ